MGQLTVIFLKIGIIGKFYQIGLLKIADVLYIPRHRFLKVTMTTISPFAIVSPEAQIGENVEIGHFCLIESSVTIGRGCKLASHVVIKSGVSIGENNQFCEGSVIGGAPQHVSALPPFGQIRIGDGNVFREHTTIHRSLKEHGTTVIGNENYLMINAHVAHDCVIGNNNILVNNVMLGGHVTIGNRAVLGGAAAIHQNARVGSLAMVGGQAHVTQDIPPFMMVDGLTGQIVGLNLVGLRRSGRTSEDIKILKGAYFTLYRKGLTWKETLEVFQEDYSMGPVAELTEFLQSTKRGITRERASSRSLLRVAEPNETVSGEADTAIPTIRATG